MGEPLRRAPNGGQNVTGTFAPEEPLARDPSRGDDAVERLQDRSRSPTARVFAAGSVLRESPLSLEAVLVAYARRANRLDVTIAPAVRDDLVQLCSAASEQEYAVSRSRVLERTTPSTKAEALAAARRRLDAPPDRRADQLVAFVNDARAAGIDLSMDDFDGTPGMEAVSSQGQSRSNHALVDQHEHEYVEPPVAERPAEPTLPTVTDDGVYPGRDEAGPSQVAVDGGEEKTVADEPDEEAAESDQEETARAGQDGQNTASGSNVTEESEQDLDPTIAKTEVTGPAGYRLPRQMDHADPTAAETESESDRETDSAVIPTYEEPDTGSDEKTVGSTTERKSEDAAGGEEPEDSTDEESGFVWPADNDDDIDPDVSPTVRISDHVDEESREGPAALVTEECTGAAERTPSEIHENIDLSTRGETPVVRIVERNRTDGGPPDPRALTASLSATGTSVTDALESS